MHQEKVHGFQPSLQKWRVNEFRKNLSNLNDDDVFISEPTNRLFGLQCSYTYAPRNLRRISYANDADGNVLFGKKDLSIVNGVESNSDQHSPILGWAYDGNPIYGPYGYSRRDGGDVVQMKSGYVDESSKKDNRPPFSSFPAEFFVEDFTYKVSNDDSVLDENNGRFCVTPEYPKGTYAYFATFDSTPASDGIFKNFKKPKFPYLIGNKYNSKPNKFNFSRVSNQENFDINESNAIRNTYPIAVNKDFSGYDYFTESYKFVDQDSNIDFVTKGGVNSVGITSGGINYKVNDKVVFDPNVGNFFKARAKVTRLSGSVSNISVSKESVSGVKFYRQFGDTFVGIASTSINLQNKVTVNVEGLSSTVQDLSDAYQIGVSSTRLILTQGIGTAGATGIVTFFPIRGDISQIRTNDRFKVGLSTETVKVLDVDPISNRLRVLRPVEAVGVSHTQSTILEEIPRVFTFESTLARSPDNKESD